MGGKCSSFIGFSDVIHWFMSLILIRTPLARLWWTSICRTLQYGWHSMDSKKLRSVSVGPGTILYVCAGSSLSWGCRESKPRLGCEVTRRDLSLANYRTQAWRHLHSFPRAIRWLLTTRRSRWIPPQRPHYWLTRKYPIGRSFQL